MTNDNYTTLTNQELVSEIRLFKTNLSNLNKMIQNRNPVLFNEIVSRTNFLDKQLPQNHVPISARIYCLENNVSAVPLCRRPNCTNRVKWDATGFRHHCSNSCCQNDPDVINQHKETSFRKYGCSCSLQHPDVKKKCEVTCLERYGDTIPMKSQIVQDKYRQTCTDRYGVDWASKLESTKEKQRETNEVRHGGTGFASKEISDKVKQANLEHLGVEFASQSEEWRNKVRETSQRKWHVDNPFQSEEVKEKTRNTIMQKHGVDHISKVKSIMEKRDQILVEKYGGVGYASSSIKEKCEQTCEDKFGVKNYTQSNEYKEQHDEIQSKRTQTCETKYGVSHYAQTKEFARAIHKPYTNPKYPGITFDRTWEFRVYDFLTEHNIPFEYHPSISIPYECEGTHHTYHPDFKVSDKIVEVKGDQFFRINESTGKEEMFCPWRGDLSDEEYEFKCKVEEAKHQCMLANNVTILRGKDIDNLTIEMFI